VLVVYLYICIFTWMIAVNFNNKSIMTKSTPVKHTDRQYDEAVKDCKDIFLKKTRDYGTSWRVLRTISIADQLYIKARRIRTLQETGQGRVGEDKKGEFVAMVNYGVIGLIQLSLGADTPDELSPEEAERLYNAKAVHARSVMRDKNHDYGEAWRDMSQESFVDLILMKILRIRQIVANDGATLISEGIDSNFTDIINYSLFALILIGEGKQSA
jgi:Nucleotide modification associated domain 1